MVVLGIAVGAYLLLRGKPAAPAAQNGAGSTPSSSTQATTSPRSTATGRTATAATTRYTLKTPAKAGGYTKLSTVPTAVQTAAGVTSAAIKDAATKDGGKVASQVTAAYQLSGGQVLAFTGFTGTFNPAKIMTSLATLGTDSNIAAAGRHGGMLACATAPGSGGVSKGTVCVWVTKTTLGVTEFFGTNGPETVTDQSKAAADALKVRDDVEVSKS